MTRGPLAVRVLGLYALVAPCTKMRAMRAPLGICDAVITVRHTLGSTINFVDCHILVGITFDFVLFFDCCRLNTRLGTVFLDLTMCGDVITALRDVISCDSGSRSL